MEDGRAKTVDIPAAGGEEGAVFPREGELCHDAPEGRNQTEATVVWNTPAWISRAEAQGLGLVQAP